MKKFLLASMFVASLLYAKPGGTLVFARGADSSLLDPGHVTDVESIYATRQLYDTLVRFKKNSTEIEPALAKSYEISEDGLEYVFHLRDDVYFAPTKYYNKKTKMTADDVVFSLKRQFDKNHPYYKITGTYDYWLAMGMSDIVKDVIKIDDYTIKITLKKNEAPFLANIAMDFAGILCKDYADELLKKGRAEDINRFPVGTGPFVFLNWKKDEVIVMRANKDYWDEKPKIDRLILKVVPNASVVVAELKSGQSQIAEHVNFSDLKELEKDPKINVAKDPGVNVSYIALNTEREWFKNPLVRQAFNHAVNKKAIVEAVFEGYAKEAYSPIPPTIWSYTDDLVKYEYNPQKAKELLRQAGYENGFSVNVLLNPTSERKKIAEMLQADLAKIGVKVNVQMYDFTTYLQRTKNLEHDMAIMGWNGDNGDPDNFLYINLSKQAAIKPVGNFAAWKNDEFDTLITKAKESTSHEERVKLYEKAQKIFAKEVPWINISYRQDVYPMAKNVKGLDINNVSGMKFNSVYFED